MDTKTMTTRFTSAAALILALSMPAAALAQGYPASGAVVTPTTPNEYVASTYDDVTTGSLGRRLVDNSAKEGNAEQPNRSVPNYGTTSGGPAY